MASFDLTAFKTAFASADDKTSTMSTEDFWKSMNDDGAWSLWKCTYDYAEDNEGLDATKEIVKSFITKTEGVKDQCFVVMHVLEPSLEIIGLILCKGPDPEFLFAANDDTSWFTWAQLGPSMTDGTKAEILELFAAKETYKGKNIAETTTL